MSNTAFREVLYISLFFFQKACLHNWWLGFWLLASFNQGERDHPRVVKYFFIWYKGPVYGGEYVYLAVHSNKRIYSNSNEIVDMHYAPGHILEIVSHVISDLMRITRLEYKNVLVCVFCHLARNHSHERLCPLNLNNDIVKSLKYVYDIAITDRCYPHQTSVVFKRNWSYIRSSEYICEWRHMDREGCAIQKVELVWRS